MAPYLCAHIFGCIRDFKSLTKRTYDKEPIIVLEEMELLMLEGLIFHEGNFGVFLPITSGHDERVIKGTFDEILLIGVEVSFMFLFTVDANMREALVHT